MKFARFKEKVDEVIAKVQTTLTVKGKEYVRNDNPFHNFEKASSMKGITPYEALDGMLTKHMVSYYDMLNDIEQGKIPTKAYVDEKLGDIITYFILQKVQLEDLAELNDSKTHLDKYIEEHNNKKDTGVKVINPMGGSEIKGMPMYRGQLTDTKG